MNNKKKRFISAFVNILLIFIVFILRYSGVATLKIGGAVPNLLIPLSLSIALFYSEAVGAWSGLCIGILIDSVSAENSFFSTLYFFIGVSLCSVMTARLLNRNFKSAACLSLGMSFGYFFLKYLISFPFKGISVNYDYFVLTLIPSAVYTAVWILPFYFLQKKLTEL